MATVKTRINISISDDISAAIAKLARRDQVPQATKAAHLIEMALEIEEDMIWNEKAAQRDRKGARFVSHKKVWA